ncbi:MAG: hypothetical protein JJ909_02215 [Roseivirga sp.]|uniref:hypothetical protein n=1 Tax=Roseivirga sp. TaxID=1964215 RepID=UPI001B2CD5D9|nr:hypothetical protein [Roseivirga sp.]MBO6662134.1 hypothetical protein [Roseivirga sp.]MBO6759775.1 hypothetical protein [Roseivirga sp.]MBO6910138.1 hypothetical protein [Roseivirga sp.]|tara:strand:- start:67 stop:669 length:603 start_codon:yes stop_codon:yes gene_type:complete
MIEFRTYTDQNEAFKKAAILKDSNIECELTQFTENGALFFRLELEEESIALAKELLKEVDEVSGEDFLADFSNEELVDMLVNSHTYSPVMVDAAKTMLVERNPNFDFSSLEKQKNENEEQLKTGVNGGKGQILFGYLFAIAGGIIGLGIGWFLETSKTKSNSGESYYTYDESSRKHGRRIKWLSIFFIILYTVLRFLWMS